MTRNSLQKLGHPNSLFFIKHVSGKFRWLHAFAFVESAHILYENILLVFSKNVLCLLLEILCFSVLACMYFLGSQEM